ncbi:MAG: hypothetical protein RLZZ540_3059 [Bacteroidota bacterium]
MATPRKRFVEALKILYKLQNKGVVGIYTDVSRNFTETPHNTKEPTEKWQK